MRGLIGSIGQITARENKDEAFELFKKIYKTTILVYFLISLGLIVLLNPFIKIWLGSNYLLEQQVVLIIALQFFVTGLQYPSYLFRTALGLYQKGKWSPIILMTVYLLGSFLLIPKFGVVGSALSIAIARLMSTTWVDPFLVFKSYFNKSCFRFIIRQYAIIICFIILEIFFVFSFLLKCSKARDWDKKEVSSK
ncbi:polysaccharide biosynthesis protein [Listeria fleischmannii FSL S10-1203]|uniref:Polysaccharide biosynthesis protein n=2 Tax=Listeria fleischmannii TaxID=1069827 RepID=W7DRL2_9LIST|nr:polysaccharide biosynthesis protein [Listeria fleischmannii FSL S10-1203]